MKNGFLSLITLHFFLQLCGQSADTIISINNDHSITPTKAVKAVTQTKQETWVIVFIHGIMSIKPHVTAGNFLRLLVDAVDETNYSRTVKMMRQDSFFHQNQAMQRLGLHKVSETVIPGNASGALATAFNQVEKEYGIDHKNLYYTFGWSGLLSAHERYVEARTLFEQLENELQSLKSQGLNPKMRLIGYSHGGNVLLNLAAIRQDYYPKSSIVVDEAILLATPIQEETDYLAGDPIFKNIFNFFSLKDRVQQLDFFSSSRFWAERYFQSRKEFQLPHKIKQVQFKVVRTSKAVQKNPSKIKLTEDLTCPSNIFARSHLLTDVSPGHGEVWFFGWTPMHYRTNFPLYPLPAVIYSLPIIEKLKRMECDPNTIIIADIRPNHNQIIIREQASTQIKSVIPFPNQEAHKKIVDTVKLYAPQEYTNQMYNEHIKIAMKAVENEDQQLASIEAKSKPRYARHKKAYKKSTVVASTAKEKENHS